MLAGYGHLLRAGQRLQWDAEAIDLSADADVVAGLQPAHHRRVSRLLAGFWVAEHGVAAQLAPFVASTDGTARACFELQADDERRHARFFDRVLREVLGVNTAATARALAGSAIVALFERELPARAAALATGRADLGDAVGLYHLVLEGIVLAAGEEALLEEAAALPGVAEGAARVQADERWHIGLGVQVLSEADVAVPVTAALGEDAVRAWGSELVTPARVARTLAAHRRRLRLLERRRPVAAGPV